MVFKVSWGVLGVWLGCHGVIRLSGNSKRNHFLHVTGSSSLSFPSSWHLLTPTLCLLACRYGIMVVIRQMPTN